MGHPSIFDGPGTQGTNSFAGLHHVSPQLYGTGLLKSIFLSIKYPSVNYVIKAVTWHPTICLPHNFQLPQAHIAFGGDRIVDWYIDSGATNNVTTDFSNLTIQQDLTTPEQLVIGDGSGLPILSSGSSIFHTPAQSFALNNILCPSDFHELTLCS